MGNRKEVQIRWLIKRDMADVLRIEHESFCFPWTEEEFLLVLRQRNRIGMVAEHEHKVVGFMIYELHRARLGLHNFAVAEKFRRSEVGTQMVRKLVGKLSPERRTEITLEVEDRNLTAHLFFRNQGFKATEVLHDWYEDPVRDAYSMRYQLREIDDTLLSGSNRISAYLPKENDG
jgi:ribosomal-protein-alanine N-acetyltransferase